MNSPSKFPCWSHHSFKVKKGVFRMQKIFRALGSEVTREEKSTYKFQAILLIEEMRVSPLGFWRAACSIRLYEGPLETPGSRLTWSTKLTFQDSPWNEHQLKKADFPLLKNRCNQITSLLMSPISSPSLNISEVFTMIFIETFFCIFSSIFHSNHLRNSNGVCIQVSSMVR